MATVLVLSSHVAASRVGGFVQALALGALGIDAILAPTVLFGRHPGWGAPGGGAVTPDLFGGLIDGVEAQGLFGALDAVVTGYFANAEQVALAAAAIDRVRAARGDRSCPVLVDPVLGDLDGGLYVKPAVSAAVIADLVPRADILTPNLWELGHITGQPVATTAEAIAAAHGLCAPDRNRRVLVTSAPAGPGMTGVLEVGPQGIWRVTHGRMATAPNGTGDLFAALVIAGVIEGRDSPGAVMRAAAGVVDALDATVAANAQDLVIVTLGARLHHPQAPVTVEAL